MKRTAGWIVALLSIAALYVGVYLMGSWIARHYPRLYWAIIVVAALVILRGVVVRVIAHIKRLRAR